jgi:hypothetical protein
MPGNIFPVREMRLLFAICPNAKGTTQRSNEGQLELAQILRRLYDTDFIPAVKSNRFI